MKWIVFECLCYFITSCVPLSVQYGWQGWTLISTCGYLTTVIDWFAFPHFKKNMTSLNKQGWPSWQVWLIMLFNVFAQNAIVGLIYEHCLHQSATAPFQFKLGIQTVWQVMTNMAITEIMFTSAHLLLHSTNWGSKVHHMHHCCKDASWSTNLIFHPLDLAAEFGGPILSIIFMHAFVWQDKATLLASTLVLHLWYAADHSANFKLPHVTHHSHLSSVFTIYIKHKIQCPQGDKVRALFMKTKKKP